MNYEQIIIYYAAKADFDLDKTIIFLKEMGFSLKNPSTKSITICQEEGESEADYEHVKKLFAENKPFSIIAWLDSVSYVYFSFYDDEKFTFTIYIDQLNTTQIRKTVEIFIVFILKEIRRVSLNIIGCVMDTDGHTYEYDFDSFFSEHDETLYLNYLPDFILIPEEKTNNVILDNRFKQIQLGKDFVVIAKNSICSYLENLLQ
jgi:hypothetical protein